MYSKFHRKFFFSVYIPFGNKSPYNIHTENNTRLLICINYEYVEMRNIISDKSETRTSYKSFLIFLH